MTKIESLLSNPDFELTRQLKINYNLIEVSDGWCFNIEERRFVEEAIQVQQIDSLRVR